MKDFLSEISEDVARKQMVSAVLYGKEPILEDISVYCDEEKFEKENKRKMGFC